jgi:hypothetical protein
MGSLAASQYDSAVEALTGGLPAAAQEAATASLAGALHVAGEIGGAAGELLKVGAESAFVDGVHLAVTVGAFLCAVAAGLVLRYLPRTVTHEGAMHGGAESLEDVAELGLAGLPPAFADTVRSDAEIDLARAAADAFRPAPGAATDAGDLDDRDDPALAPT